LCHYLHKVDYSHLTTGANIPMQTHILREMKHFSAGCHRSYILQDKREALAAMRTFITYFK
jgi:hypothetical protein